MILKILKNTEVCSNGRRKFGFATTGIIYILKYITIENS